MSLSSQFSVVAVLFIFSVANTKAAQFDSLGDFAGGQHLSLGLGTSYDGSVVVGASNGAIGDQEFQRAFRWTVSSGMVGLGDTGRMSSAHATSGDGTVIVGVASLAGNSSAFRWTEGSDMIALPALPGSSGQSGAAAVSRDGAVTVGYNQFPLRREAVRWVGTNVEALGTLTGISGQSSAAAASADGSVVVGESTSFSNPVREAFYWSESRGMIGLGDLPGGRMYSAANDVSDDWAIVVGLSYVGDGDSEYEAFRWTAESGMIGLGDLPGDIYRSQATAISGDGSTIVGLSFGEAGDEPFIWTRAGEMKSLSRLLAEQGLSSNIAGWLLYAAVDVSYDGSVIVGYGRNPEGHLEAWRAVLTPVPEPATLISALVGLVALVFVAAKRRVRCS